MSLKKTTGLLFSNNTRTIDVTLLGNPLPPHRVMYFLNGPLQVIGAYTKPNWKFEKKKIEMFSKSDDNILQIIRTRTCWRAINWGYFAVLRRKELSPYFWNFKKQNKNIPASKRNTIFFTKFIFIFSKWIRVTFWQNNFEKYWEEIMSVNVMYFPSETPM